MTHKDEGGSRGAVESRSLWGQATRLDFPHFCGEDFNSWITKVEYNFQVDETQAMTKLK